jgi:hypothetical protein
MVEQMRVRLAVLSLLAVMAGGCDGGGSETSDSSPARSSEIRLGEAPVFSLEAPGEGEAPFHEISSIVLLSNGRLAVADQTQRIVVLDADGSLLASFGGRGDGPGEFRRMGWIQPIHGDSLIAYDPVLGRGSVFSTEGAHARTIVPEPRAGGSRPPRLLGVFENGDLLASEQLLAPPPDGGSGIIRPDMIVTRHGPDGTFLDSLTLLPADERVVAQGVLVNLPFLRSTSVAIDGNRFHAATGDDFVVGTYDQDGALVQTVRRDVELRPVTEEVLASVEVAKPLVPLLPTHLPAVSDILSDPLGRLWVGSNIPELDEAGVAWRVFDSGGELIHNVPMPHKFRPLDVGATSIVGIWTGEFGVEFVRLYPILQSGG